MRFVQYKPVPECVLVSTHNQLRLILADTLSNMSKSKNTELSFEDALERLESLIESMEDGETPLAELVEKFEEGTKLLKSCQANLKQAELTIEKLNLDTDTLEALDPEAENE